MAVENNKYKIIIVLLVVIIVILAGLCILFATETISFRSQIDDVKEARVSNQTKVDDAGDETNVDNTIKNKLIDNLVCNNSSESFNGISVKVEQKDDNGMCSLSSITVNDKDITSDVSMWIDSYEIYDNNVIILSGDTSQKLLTIYSLSSEEVLMKLDSSNLQGYKVQSYTTDGNKISIIGKECGEQCGNKSTGYPNATFEIEYSNNSFDAPKLTSRTAD